MPRSVQNSFAFCSCILQIKFSLSGISINYFVTTAVGVFVFVSSKKMKFVFYFFLSEVNMSFNLEWLQNKTEYQLKSFQY